jgi:hypothetical protein
LLSALFGAFPGTKSDFSAWRMQDKQLHGGCAMFDSQSKFQSEKVIADVYLAIAIAGANTLIVMGAALAFVII